MNPELLQALIVAGIIAIAYGAFRFIRWRMRIKEEARMAGMTFIFVKIPESIMPAERGEKYQGPLDESLRSKDLGQVLGAGTELGEPDAEGKRFIQWVGLDIGLSDMERGLPFLKNELSRLGAPLEGSAWRRRSHSYDSRLWTGQFSYVILFAVPVVLHFFRLCSPTRRNWNQINQSNQPRLRVCEWPDKRTLCVFSNQQNAYGRSVDYRKHATSFLCYFLWQLDCWFEPVPLVAAMPCWVYLHSSAVEFNGLVFE
jgi:hypothetical protein